MRMFRSQPPQQLTLGARCWTELRPQWACSRVLAPDALGPGTLGTTQAVPEREERSGGWGLLVKLLGQVLLLRNIHDPASFKPVKWALNGFKIANVQSMHLANPRGRVLGGLPKVHILELGQVSSYPLDRTSMVSKNSGSFILANLEVPLNNAGKEI